jgi:hypothetical protein
VATWTSPQSILKRRITNAAIISWKWATPFLQNDLLLKLNAAFYHLLYVRAAASGSDTVSGTAKLSDDSTIATRASALLHATVHELASTTPDPGTGAYSLSVPSGEVDIVISKDYGVSWKASTNYEPNALVHPTAANTNGHYYKQTTAGSVSGTVRATSGSAEPTWPAGAGATVTDSGITWTEQGTMLRPMIHGPVVPG